MLVFFWFCIPTLWRELELWLFPRSYPPSPFPVSHTALATSSVKVCRHRPHNQNTPTTVNDFFMDCAELCPTSRRLDLVMSGAVGGYRWSEWVKVEVTRGSVPLGERPLSDGLGRGGSGEWWWTHRSVAVTRSSSMLQCMLCSAGWASVNSLRMGPFFFFFF